LKNDRVYWYGIDIGVLASVFLASVVPMAPFSALLDSARPQMTNLPISALREKWSPRNINHMPAIQFLARLDLDQICRFLDGPK
jgi:hypothetical protein